jgi:large conductance mechanosensitive channel
MDPKKALALGAEPAKKAFSLLEEFKAFALKGNVIDLAVGVIIGAAFGKIVDSLVKNIIMPLISLVTPSEKGYETWALPVLGKTIPFGLFLASVVDFLIITLALYLFIVKFLGWIMRTKHEAPPPKPTKEQELLTEIRDLLKSRSA